MARGRANLGESETFPRPSFGFAVVCLLLFILEGCRGDTSNSPDQQTMLQIKNELSATPDNRPLLNRIYADADPCNWVGVICSGSTDKAVVSISTRHIPNWTGQQLQGGLPGTFGSLSNLVRLDLSENNFSGVIPDALFSATKIECLSLNSNSLTGPIPMSIGNLQMLSLLDVSENSLNGTLEPLGGLNASIISSIYLQENAFTGNLSALETLASLVVANISSNRLVGNLIPLQGLKKLQIVLLDGNQLYGSLTAISDLEPDDLTISQLQIVSLGFNDLDGAIPRSLFGGNSRLQSIRLPGNNFTGSIPSDNLLTSKFMSSVDLSDNFLANSSSKLDFAKARVALEILLGGNELEGQISSYPQAAVTLDVSHNLLTGQLPEFAGTEMLQTLLLNGNRFFGVLPPSIANVAQLVILNLSRNAFSGDVGTLPPNIQSVDLSHNRLSTLADWGKNASRETLRNLKTLLLNDNGFEGLIPPGLMTMTSIETLDLSQNSFTSLPAIGILDKLVSLNLSQNRLAGEVPEALVKLATDYNLKTIDLSNNNFTGELPEFPCPSPRYRYFFDGNPNLCSDKAEFKLPRCSPRGSRWIKTASIVLRISGEVCLLAILVLIGCIVRLMLQRRNARKHELDPELIAAITDGESVPRLIPLKDLLAATDNFSPATQIGAGGFGTVHKGVLPNGKLVAIKKTRKLGSAEAKKQFMNEVQVLLGVNHRYLVRLLGCCLTSEFALLVLEYVPQGTLAEHLRGSRNGAQPLTWNRRLKIAHQTAEALAYLHFGANPTIYHRDIKSANILLDVNLDAKVGDFGLSKLVTNLDATHVTTFSAQGTRGYMDPELYASFQLTSKSDVYSFGVVLLELISAQRAYEPREEEGSIALLAALVGHFLTADTLFNMLDPILLKELQSSERAEEIKVSILKVAKLASRCIERKPADRPTMNQVVSNLLNLRVTLGITEFPSNEFSTTVSGTVT